MPRTLSPRMSQFMMPSGDMKDNNTYDCPRMGVSTSKQSISVYLYGISATGAASAGVVSAVGTGTSVGIVSATDADASVGVVSATDADASIGVVSATDADASIGVVSATCAATNTSCDTVSVEVNVSFSDCMLY